MVETTNVFQNDIFKGKVCFVTGGGSGICMGMTEALMRHGCDAIITSRNLEKLTASALALSNRTGRKCIAVQADVRDYTSIQAAVKLALSTFEKIDIVVCGAAGNFLAPAEKLSVNAFKTVIDIDLLGTFNTIKATFEALKSTKGSVINVSATLQYNGTPLQVHACSAKAGIDAMTKVLALEWGQFGIRVNVIAPGPIFGTVGMSKLTPAGSDDAFLAKLVPLQKYGTIQDIEFMTIFLASDAAKWITGGIFVVDGGQWLAGTGGIVGGGVSFQMTNFKILFFCILQLVTAIKANVHPFDAKDLVKFKRISHPSVHSNRAIYNVLVYENTTITKELHLLDISTNVSVRLTFGKLDHSPFFVSKDTALFLSTRSGLQQIWQWNEKNNQVSQVSFYPIGVDNLKFKSNGSHVLFTAQVYVEGEGTLDEAAILDLQESIKLNSGIVYDELFVRHWDKYLAPSKRTQLFVAKLNVQENGHISLLDPINLLKNTRLETPVGPFGDESHFDIASDGKEVVFTSREPSVSKAWETNLDIYVVPTDGSLSPKSISADNKGSDSLPSYSPDGKYIAWLQMQTPGYEADNNDIVLYKRRKERAKILTQKWDRSAESITWSQSSDIIYTTAQEEGHVKIFSIHISTKKMNELVSEYGNHNVIELSLDQLLFVRSTPTSPPEIYTALLSSEKKVVWQRTFLNQHSLNKILSSSPEKFWYRGAMDDRVMGWLHKPSTFMKNEKYPLLILFHGGPEGAWNADFGFRWNPQVFSGAGYVVATINFHGSTGYGSKFQRAIQNQWGGHPYNDIMLGLDYLIEKYPFIDSEKICGLGASYGGYMANWINGQTNRFSCLVSHDGIFSTTSAYYATEELWFPEFEFSGPAFNRKDMYEKWSPSSYVKNMETPMLLIHGEKDYRLPVTEGLSAFTALQRQGVPSRLLYFPNENHWVQNPENLIQWYSEVLRWVKYWTNAHPSPASLYLRKRKGEPSRITKDYVFDE